MNSCSTCGGNCPAPTACHLPIQPSAEEIRRDRLDLWKSRLSYAAVIGGMCIAAAVVAFAFGRAYAG